MKPITLTKEEQQAIMDFIAVNSAYGTLAQSNFESDAATQKAIRLSHNQRVLTAVLENSNDAVQIADVRDHLVDLSDPLVTRWHLLLPNHVKQQIASQDEAFKAFAIEQLKINGLTDEEAGRAVGKIIPFPLNSEGAGE